MSASLFSTKYTSEHVTWCLPDYESHSFFTSHSSFKAYDELLYWNLFYWNFHYFCTPSVLSFALLIFHFFICYQKAAVQLWNFMFRHYLPLLPRISSLQRATTKFRWSKKVLILRVIDFLSCSSKFIVDSRWDLLKSVFPNIHIYI